MTGKAVDAGLQYNPVKSGNPVADYTPWVLVNGTPYTGTIQRLKPANGIPMTFWVKQDNQVTLTITGNLESNNNQVTQTVIMAASGWKADGSGNVIKRFTSITRYAGFIGPIQSVSFVADWQGVVLGSSWNGTSSTALNQHYWDEWQTDTDSAKTGTAPLDGDCSDTTGHPAVTVDALGLGIETVTVRW